MEYTNVFNADYVKIASAPIIYPKFKIEILDSNENAIMEITQNISADSSGDISINYQQGVRRSCSITLIDDDGALIPKSENGLFWIGRKFKVYIGLSTKKVTTSSTTALYSDTQTDTLLYGDAGTDLILFSDGMTMEEDIYWFSQGVYYLTNPTAMRNLSNHTVVINGVDKFGVLGAELGYNQITSSLVIEAGQSIYEIIRNILSLDIGNGQIVDPILPVLDPLFINSVLPYDINKSPGSYFGEILIELGKILGADIFYDVDGRLNLVSATNEISFSQKSSIWEYTDILPEYSGAGITYDFVNAVNVVKVVADNVASAVIEYTAENNNPLSSTRVDLIGRKILFINTSFVFDMQSAQDYAEYMLNIKSIIQAKINFSSSLLPHLDVNNVVGITDTYFGYVQQRFVVQSLSIPLTTSSLISISASNIAELPFFES